MSDGAPIYHDLAAGPAGGRGFWLHAADGVRLRAAHWPGGSRGTVMLFAGRTEYIEKYGRAAADLAARGYGTLCIDWRGQGLSDRPLPDPMTGHVANFAEYQLDVQALAALADDLDLPGPRYLLSHSLGGAIALRALMLGLPVQAAVFSAPMWGIGMATWMRPVARVLAEVSRVLQQDHRYAPGTSPVTYVAEAPFVGNVLTSDPDMFAMMKAQVAARPELSLGGPSLGWLHAALAECRALAALPSPDISMICALGSAEKVVNVAAIHQRMAGWAKGRLDLYPGSEHEVMMETPAQRKRFFDSAAALFDSCR
ncbi:MAG: alpha/beta hydrolase [Pseudorhodobacter sp.]|nr:alpha/beta hydrolase [Pseudorhodobacter sp.]